MTTGELTEVLCPDCGHDIDAASGGGCAEMVYDDHYGWQDCECWKSPSDIARAVLTAEPTANEVNAAMAAFYENRGLRFSETMHAILVAAAKARATQ